MQQRTLQQVEVILLGVVYFGESQKIRSKRQGCLMQRKGRRRRPFFPKQCGFAAIYSTFMTLDIVHVHFDCAGSQNLPAGGGCFRRLRARCGAARILAHGGHFSRQVRGKPRVLVLQSRLFVTGARDRSCFTSKCSFRGRRSTSDMAVVVDEL